MRHFRTIALIRFIACTPLRWAASAFAADSAGDLALYTEGQFHAPYTLYIGTPDNWARPVPRAGALDVDGIKIEPSKIGDAEEARKVTWSGIGQVFMQSPRTTDLKGYLDDDGALEFDAIVDEPPTGDVVLRVDCNYPCMGTMDASRLFKSLPAGDVVKIKIPLSCFARDGAKFTAVNTPFLMYATAKFSVSIANLRWVKGAAKDTDARSNCA